MPASPQRRRGRHHQPIPTAVLLRNAILPPASSDGAHAAVPNKSMVAEDRPGRRRRPADHGTVGLLPPPSSLRLELVADRAALSEDMLQKLDQIKVRSDKDEVILHTLALPFASASSPALHLQWYHLDEKVALLEHARQQLDAKCDAGASTSSIDAATWENIYKALRARIVMQLSSMDGSDEPAPDSAVAVLAELPLHPTDLRRLPRSTPSGDAIDEDGGDVFYDDQNSPRNGASADEVTNIIIPPALPPNALLVHYSDGKTRIDPDLYQRLVKAGVVSEVKSSMLGRTRIDSGVLEDQIREDRKARRFDDDLFDMLGGNGGDGSDANQESEPIHIDSGNDNDSDRDINTSFKDDEFDLLGGGSHEEPMPIPSKPTNSQSNEPTTIDNDFPMPNSESVPSPHSTVDNSPHAIPSLPTSDDAEIEDIRAEISELKTMLANEKQCLEEEQCELANSASGLRILVEETKYTKLEVEMMNEDALEQEHLRNEALILLEVRRAKVLRDLRQIYPIQRLPDKVYTIGGLHLPADLNNPNVPDAVVSTALGYVCHLVYMCSKYLRAPLRYRLFCNSSRSAVQDDGVAVYPLFRERVVEQEQFDRACTLLSRNVECLLRVRCIVVTSNRSHILEKVNLLFEEAD